MVISDIGWKVSCTLACYWNNSSTAFTVAIGKYLNDWNGSYSGQDTRVLQWNGMVAIVAWSSRKDKRLVVKQQMRIAGLVGQYLSQVADRNKVTSIVGARSNTSDKNGSIL